MSRLFLEKGRLGYVVYPTENGKKGMKFSRSLGSSIMMLLYVKDEMRLKDMVKELGGSKSAYSGALAYLKKQKLRTFRVERVEGRKRVYHKLTKKGRSEVEKFLAKRSKA